MSDIVYWTMLISGIDLLHFNKFKDYKNRNHFDSRPMKRKIKIIWGLMTIKERDAILLK